MSIKQITYHVLFWIIVTASFTISEWGYMPSFRDALIYELLLLPSRLIAVYVNWFILIPMFLYRNKLLPYFAILILVLLILAIAHRYFVLYWGFPTYFPQWMEGQKIEPLHFAKLLQALLIIISPVAYTTGFKLFMDWYKQRRQTEVLIQEKTNAELKFLRSQTNPHFLFNTLNSIYGLALAKSEKTPNLILKLSDILSYTLYESNTQKVLLSKELKLIENIIALEKERYEKRVKIDYVVEGEVDGIQIPPLILVPFIENAFKHGLKNEVKKGWIKVHITVTKEHLMFTAENSISKQEEESNGGGLGLQNICRRLDLLYGDDKKLLIDKTEEAFIVNLKIKLPTDEA
ncbi:histidine kinase [Aquimarina sp. D1M17]|uniref:sensor histidine kinase n=1 Tax=Aquimarina acroporae TaxID=2937283 RepID=UPI0020BFA592|nr:histidine kinase [Aquimarina acroporae]MCK8523109.1 histidine kinase [Aquimarina acroporae]